MRDAELQLSDQRLQELMLWHGTDEGNLPPAATLANLSRDTVAAVFQLRQTRTRWLELRAALAQVFWTCGSSETRTALLIALGAPPESPAVTEPLPVVSWQASPNGMPLPAQASDAQGTSAWPQRAAS